MDPQHEPQERTAGELPFGRQDRESIRSVALWGIIAAVASVASSVLELAIKVIPAGGAVDISSLVGLVILTLSLVLGIFLYQASVAFRRVVTTDADGARPHLLEGFDKLRLYFKVMGVAFIIAMALGGLVLLAMLSCGLAL